MYRDVGVGLLLAVCALSGWAQVVAPAQSIDATVRLDGERLITHQGEYVPMRWVPPVIGPSLIQSERRKQRVGEIEELLYQTPRAPDAGGEFCDPK
jgi:hypothetical protein